MSAKTDALLAELRATYRAEKRAVSEYAALSTAKPGPAWRAGNDAWQRVTSARSKADRLLDELRRELVLESAEPRPGLRNLPTTERAIVAVQQRMPAPPERIRAEVVGTEDMLNGGEPSTDVVLVTLQVLVRVPRFGPGVFA